MPEICILILRSHLSKIEGILNSVKLGPFPLRLMNRSKVLGRSCCHSYQSAPFPTNVKTKVPLLSKDWLLFQGVSRDRLLSLSLNIQYLPFQTVGITFILKVSFFFLLYQSHALPLSFEKHLAQFSQLLLAFGNKT